MPAFDEETFGPVGAVVRARDERTRSSWRTAPATGWAPACGRPTWRGGERLAAEIEAGSVFRERHRQVLPAAAFGGVKRSGYGRELSEAGTREFVNIKTVWVGAPSLSAATTPRAHVPSRRG